MLFEPGLHLTTKDQLITNSQKLPFLNINSGHLVHVLFKFSDGNSLCQDIKSKSIGLIPSNILYKLLNAQIVFMDSIYDENIQFIEFNQVFRPIFIFICEDELYEDINLDILKLPVFDSKINDCLVDLIAYFPKELEYLSIDGNSDLDNNEKRDSWVSLKVSNSANFTYQNNTIDDSGVYLDDFTDSTTDSEVIYKQNQLDELQGLDAKMNNYIYSSQIQNQLDRHKFGFDSIDNTNIDEFINSMGIKNERRKLSVKDSVLCALQEKKSENYTNLSEPCEDYYENFSGGRSMRDTFIGENTDQLYNSTDKVLDTENMTNNSITSINVIASKESEMRSQNYYSEKAKVRSINFESADKYDIKNEQPNRQSKSDSNNLTPNGTKINAVQNELKDDSKEGVDEEWIKSMKKILLKKKIVDLSKETATELDFKLNFIGVSVILLSALFWLKKSVPKMKL